MQWQSIGRIFPGDVTIIHVLFALLLPCLLMGQKLKISTMAPDFYVYTTYNDFQGTPFPSNSMYVVTNAGVVMVDTPWDPEQFQPLLDSIEARHHKKVVLCIATHFHDDRTAGLEFLNGKGIPTYSSRKTYDFSGARREKQAAFTFQKDTVFRVGNKTFQTFFPGAGHSPENIVIWFEQEKVLYGGCFIKSVENSSLGNLEDADVVRWQKSVRKLMKRFPAPSFVVPGHFGWADNKAVGHTAALLQLANTKKSASRRR